MSRMDERLATLAEEHRHLVAEEYLRELGCEADAQTVEQVKRRLITEPLVEAIHLSVYDDLAALKRHELHALAREIAVDVLGKADDDAAIAEVESWLPYVLRAMETAERKCHAEMVARGPNLL